MRVPIAYLSRTYHIPFPVLMRTFVVSETICTSKFPSNIALSGHAARHSSQTKDIIPFNLGPFNLGPLHLVLFNLVPFNLVPFNLASQTSLFRVLCRKGARRC